jgi:hypothetical protein
VRGATTHYDAVVGAATSGVLNASVDTGVPTVFGVLTCDTMEQASSPPGAARRARAARPAGDDGRPYAVCRNAPQPRPAAGALARQTVPAPRSRHTTHSRTPPILPPNRPAAQALDRAGGKVGNKGAEAATTAIEMANLLADLRAEGLAAPAWGPSK